MTGDEWLAGRSARSGAAINFDKGVNKNALPGHKKTQPWWLGGIWQKTRINLRNAAPAALHQMYI
jgi:hypothetical protein